MSSISINLHKGETASADVLQCEDGRAFIQVHIGSVTLMMLSFDEDCVAATKALSNVLFLRACELERMLLAKPRPIEIAAPAPEPAVSEAVLDEVPW